MSEHVIVSLIALVAMLILVGRTFYSKRLPISRMALMLAACAALMAVATLVFTSALDQP